MKDKELVQVIFNHSYIEQKNWIFDAKIDWNTVDIRIDSDNDNYIVWNKGVWKDGTWYNGRWEKGVWEKGTWERGVWGKGIWEKGTWKNGLWNDGRWVDGLWKGGTWIKGIIYNPKTGEYQESTLPPNKCPWSLSYEG
jgi:hypothetical protein